MKDILQTIADIVAILFGDTPQRPRAPRPLPTALPPAAPVPLRADPEEPQDAAEVSADDAIVISHEAEAPREMDSAEYDTNPIPAPADQVEAPALSPSVRFRGRVRPSPEYRARYMWCIDHGHGSLSPGKRSPQLPDGRQLIEYAFNRDITSRIFSQLDQLGVAYFNVIPETEVGNLLTERVDRANSLSTALPKVYLSIHGNAGPAASLASFTDDRIRGIETWYYHGSSKGRKLAAVFQRHLVATTGMANRHLRSKVTSQFYVLRASRMPAVLTENGFYNNRFDLEIMLTDAFRQQVADAHIAAIMEIERNGLDSDLTT